MHLSEPRIAIALSFALLVLLGASTAFADSPSEGYVSGEAGDSWCLDESSGEWVPCGSSPSLLGSGSVSGSYSSCNANASKGGSCASAAQDENGKTICVTVKRSAACQCKGGVESGICSYF
jgi:hypothetical protein